MIDHCRHVVPLPCAMVIVIFCCCDSFFVEKLSNLFSFWRLDKIKLNEEHVPLHRCVTQENHLRSCKFLSKHRILYIMQNVLNIYISDNSVAQWLALQPHSQKVLGMNLSQGRAFLHGVCIFSACSSFPKCQKHVYQCTLYQGTDLEVKHPRDELIVSNSQAIPNKMTQ